jgi:hypothetical protein
LVGGKALACKWFQWWAAGGSQGNSPNTIEDLSLGLVVNLSCWHAMAMAVGRLLLRHCNLLLLLLCCTLQVAGHFTTCSITVLEQRDGPQFIFGLDMLKRHQCVLDMAQSELHYCLFCLCHQTYDGTVCLAAALYCASLSWCHKSIVISSTSAAAAKSP